MTKNEKKELTEKEAALGDTPDSTSFPFETLEKWEEWIRDFERRILREQDAALCFALAFNRLDPTDLIELLAPDAIYASQALKIPLVGKKEISDYLSTKHAIVKRAIVEYGDP